MKNKRAEEAVKKVSAMQNKPFEEHHMHKITTAEKMFRVTYLCAKENLSFAKHFDITDCHKLNGAHRNITFFTN